MTKYVSKTHHHTALLLSNFYLTFEEGIASIAKFEYHRVLNIQRDPISTQHVLVVDPKQPNQFFRIEKRDIELANQDRQALYHLLSHTLDHLKHTTEA